VTDNAVDLATLISYKRGIVLYSCWSAAAVQ